MIGDPTHTILLVALLAVHLLSTLVLCQVTLPARGWDERADAEDRSAEIDRESGTVVCPDCGATNEIDCRFCRECVGELPVKTAFETGADRPIGRFVR